MTYDSTAVEAIAALAESAASAEPLELGGFYVLTSRDGALHQIDLTGDKYRDLPKRKTGTVVVRDVASFATYWGKHADAQSEIYADRDARTVTAVLDANMADGPRWQGHKLQLGLKYSEAFKAWTNHDGRAMDQETFAEFLEDQRADIFDPPAADMLEIATSLQASTKAEFQSAIALSNGQRKLSYVEDTTAKAGQRGDLTIPTEITLALAVFEGASVADKLTARFRYRIAGGKLSLHYKLDRPADVINSAFEGVITEVAQDCNAVVLRGTP
jgi:uncharacterized protein YfdQ (DUF2303 family)